MIDLNNIHSLSDFKQNAKIYLSQIQTAKQPLILTVNGEAKIVVEDIDTFQKNQQRLQQLEEEIQRLKLEALQRDVEVGIRQIQNGEGIPASEVFKALQTRSQELRSQI